MASRVSSSSPWSPPKMGWPTQLPSCCNGSSAALPRINRQRARFCGAMAMGRFPCGLQVVEVEIVEIFQCLLFRVGQFLLDRFAGDVSGNAPVFAEILRDLPLLAGTETAERAAQENQRPAEVIFFER